MSIWNKYLPTIINILSLSIYELCTFHVPMLCYYYVNLWDDCLTEINNLNLIWYYLYIHPTIWHLHCTVIHPCAASICQLLSISLEPLSPVYSTTTYIHIGFRYIQRGPWDTAFTWAATYCVASQYMMCISKLKKMSLKAVFN